MHLRKFGLTILIAGAVSALAQGQPSPVHWNKAPLEKNHFAPLPLGAIKPTGWLRNQLRIQADGLTGHLDEFWPDLSENSGWLGGSGESWERGPYYLDGLVPLAYQLEDERLIAKARKWVDWTLENQRQSGAIGPRAESGAAEWEGFDWWPNMVMLKVLAQYQEATGDERVIPLLEKYLLYHLEHVHETPVRSWGAHRWADEALSVAWVYNRTGNSKLLDLVPALARQGFDWKAHFADFAYVGKYTPNTTMASLHTHVVNNAMALKTSAVQWQFSGDNSDRDAIYQMLRVLDGAHGQAHGAHSGDEHYAGLDPSQGTELCAIVEGMFSYEQLLAILGDPAFGDRLERIAYNALPATFKPDMWAHQYDQQVNQVLVSVDESRNWSTNGPDSNIFGLEPNFGCCTANMHQGWPKLVFHLWMATRDKGLAATAYGPSKVTALVADEVAVTIEEETDYPFRGEIRLEVAPARPVEFPLLLRIPGWAEDATVAVNGRQAPGVTPGSFFTLRRTWRQGDAVELKIPMKLRTELRYRNGVAITRGPLVYSYPVPEKWVRLRGDEPHADWEVHPTGSWNYGLQVDLEDPAKLMSVSVRPVGDFPFSPDGAPVTVTAKARRVPEWRIVAGSAGRLPRSPVAPTQPTETIKLIPYGSTNLRVTVFPRIGSR